MRIKSVNFVSTGKLENVVQSSRERVFVKTFDEELIQPNSQKYQIKVDFIGNCGKKFHIGRCRGRVVI